MTLLTTTAVHATTNEAAATSFPRLALVHGDPPPVVLLIVESPDRSLSLGSGLRGLSPPSDRPCRAYSRRLRCAPPRPGAAPGSALGGPPGARRASTPIRSPDQSAHSPRIRRRRRTAPGHPAANKTAPRLDGHGSLIPSRLCSPPGQAGQGRSLRSRRHGDGASATLDSPAPPGGFRQLSDEAPPRLS